MSQLPIDLMPLVGLAYLYHGCSEFYIEDIFGISESTEHPLNFDSMMGLISDSEEATLCCSKVGNEEPVFTEKLRESPKTLMKVAKFQVIFT